MSGGSEGGSDCGVDSLTEDNIKEEGFELFKTGMIRRLSPSHYVVKSQSANGWHLVELKDGVWTCDCSLSGVPCVHVYAMQLHRYGSKTNEDESDQLHVKCRYCSSIDVAGCGFRYSAKGIARRYFCRDCHRKFSIPYVQSNPNKPNELSWLLNEVGFLLGKLNETVSRINSKLDSASPVPIDENHIQDTCIRS
jgi:hypothetical protein